MTWNSEAQKIWAIQTVTQVLLSHRYHCCRSGLVAQAGLFHIFIGAYVVLLSHSQLLTSFWFVSIVVWCHLKDWQLCFLQIEKMTISSHTLRSIVMNQKLKMVPTGAGEFGHQSLLSCLLTKANHITRQRVVPVAFQSYPQHWKYDRLVAHNRCKFLCINWCLIFEFTTFS